MKYGTWSGRGDIKRILFSSHAVQATFTSVMMVGNSTRSWICSTVCQTYQLEHQGSVHAQS